MGTGPVLWTALSGSSDITFKVPCIVPGIQQMKEESERKY